MTALLFRGRAVISVIFSILDPMNNSPYLPCRYGLFLWCLFSICASFVRILLNPVPPDRNDQQEDPDHSTQQAQRNIQRDSSGDQPQYDVGGPDHGAKAVQEQQQFCDLFILLHLIISLRSWDR